MIRVNNGETAVNGEQEREHVGVHRQPDHGGPQPVQEHDQLQQWSVCHCDPLQAGLPAPGRPTPSKVTNLSDYLGWVARFRFIVIR